MHGSLHSLETVKIEYTGKFIKHTHEFTELMTMDCGEVALKLSEHIRGT